jgi:cell wall-associated NlpC family hydrolase
MSPIDALCQYALQFVGTRYKWGGATPMGGIDCSGLVQVILQGAGIDPPGDQSAQALFNALEKTGRLGVYGAGSIAFFGESVTKITHVAFCINEYQMVEAGGGGSHTNTMDDAIAQEAFVKLSIIKRRKDLAAMLRPNYAPVGVVL